MPACRQPTTPGWPSCEADPELLARPERYREFVATQFKAYFRDPRRFDAHRYDYFDAERAAKRHLPPACPAPSAVHRGTPTSRATCPTRASASTSSTAFYRVAEMPHPHALQAVVVKDAGHFVHIEQPEAYFKAIRAFLVRVASRQDTAGTAEGPGAPPIHHQ